MTCNNRQRALRKRNFVAMGFAMKVLWQDHTFVMKCTLNALCLIWNVVHLQMDRVLEQLDKALSQHIGQAL